MSLTTTNVDQRPLLDEVLGNRSGSTVRVSVQSLALQLLAQPAFSGSALSSINLFRPSLAELQAETPELGQHGAVISTATDAGVYEYTATGWILRAPIPALLTESLAAMEAAEARDMAVAVTAALAGYTEPGYLARVEAGANAAEAWAQSSNPPDPENPASASAKTWAERSSQSAGTAGSAAGIAADNAVATAADRQQTGLDLIAVEGSKETAEQAAGLAVAARDVAVPAAASAAGDAEATAADRVQTGLDREATAADRAQTGLDREAVVNIVQMANGLPVGTVAWFASATPPDDWLVCDGRQIGGLYPDLRASLIAAGSPFGTKHDNTLPRVHDLRGEFIRGWDNGRGVDAGREFGSAQGDEIKAHSHGLPADASGNQDIQSITNSSGADEGPSEIYRTTLFGGSETRPRNVSLLPCIRAFGAVINIPGQADMDGWLQQAAVDAQAKADAAMVRLGPVNGEYLPAAYDWHPWDADQTGHSDTGGLLWASEEDGRILQLTFPPFRTDLSARCQYDFRVCGVFSVVNNADTNLAAVPSYVFLNSLGEGPAFAVGPVGAARSLTLDMIIPLASWSSGFATNGDIAHSQGPVIIATTQNPSDTNRTDSPVQVANHNNSEGWTNNGGALQLRLHGGAANRYLGRGSISMFKRRRLTLGGIL